LVLDLAERDCRDISQETINDLIRKRFAKKRNGRPYKDDTILRELIQPLTAALMR